MKILFLNERLQRLCENSRLMERELGADGAKSLRTRLAQLRAAPNLAEAVLGRPHWLKGERRGQKAFHLAGGLRLVIEPADESPVARVDGAVDETQVFVLRVLYVGDYHE